MRYAILAIVLFTALSAVVAAAAPVQPLVRTDISATDVVPGQTVVLNITVLAPTWMTRAPGFPEFDLPDVMIRIPPDAQYSMSEQIDGTTWAGVSIDYEIAPLAAGQLRIPAQQILVTHADPDTRAPIETTVWTEAVIINVTIPPDAVQLVPFIAATSLTLDQRVEGDPAALEAGDAFKRIVSARIDGGTPFALPALIAALNGEGLSEYPAAVTIDAGNSNEGVPGERTESVTYVASGSGRFEAPAIVVQWYKLDTQTIETAEAAGFEIVAQGPLPGLGSSPNGVRTGMIFGAAGGAVLLLILGRRLAPRVARWRRRRRASYLESERCAFQQVRNAVKAQRIGETIVALARWRECLPATDGVSETLMETTLETIKTARYRDQSSPLSTNWSDLGALLRPIRGERLAARATRSPTKHLPPLNPVGK